MWIKSKQNKLLVATYNMVRPNKAYSTSWKIFNWKHNFLPSAIFVYNCYHIDIYSRPCNVIFYEIFLKTFVLNNKMLLIMEVFMVFSSCTFSTKVQSVNYVVSPLVQQPSLKVIFPMKETTTNTNYQMLRVTIYVITTICLKL